MLRKEVAEKKGKPRGKPFVKKGERKMVSETMDVEGYTGCDQGEVIVSPFLHTHLEPIKPEENNILDMHKMVSEAVDSAIKEAIGIPQKNQMDTGATQAGLVEKMDFSMGENILSIHFSRKDNRMYTIKVFLNDEQEIRPVTYNGSSTACAFWNLLKRSLKK